MDKSPVEATARNDIESEIDDFFDSCISFCPAKKSGQGSLTTLSFWFAKTYKGLEFIAFLKQVKYRKRESCTTVLDSFWCTLVESGTSVVLPTMSSLLRREGYVWKSGSR
jgi:hypothetical protein